MKFQWGNREYQFSEDDVINPDDMIPNGEFNPHNVRPWLMLKLTNPRGRKSKNASVIGVVFASCEQDALDEAVDSSDCMDRFQVTAAELVDYKTGEDSEGNPEYSGIAMLGNASEPFDIESLDLIGVSTSRWTYQYWTQCQLERIAEDILDGLKPHCGRRDSAIVSQTTKLAAILLE